MNDQEFRWHLARIGAGYVCLHACLSGVRMAAPLQSLHNGHSELAVGLLMAFFSLSQVFLALPAGRFADRRGFKRPMAIAIVLSCGGTAASVAFPVFPVLCLNALCCGGANGFAMIALQRHVGRIARDPGQLRAAFSWLATAPAVAGFVGPTLAGAVIDNVGFRAAFFAVALLPLATWFCIRPLAQRLPEAVAARSKDEKAWDLWRDPSFRRLVVVSVLLTSCWDVHTFVLPVLGHERGLPASVIGMILGAAAISAALIRVLLPRIAAYVPEWTLVSSAMLAASVLLIVYPLLPVPAAMGACSVLLGMALGSVQPMIMSTMHQMLPDHRQGDAIAMRWMAVNVSSVTMPMVFGLAGSVVGVKAVFWMVGAAAGAGSRFAFQLRDALAASRKS